MAFSLVMLASIVLAACAPAADGGASDAEIAALESQLAAAEAAAADAQAAAADAEAAASAAAEGGASDEEVAALEAQLAEAQAAAEAAAAAAAEEAAPVEYTSTDTSTFVYATFGDVDTLDPALAYDTASGNVIDHVYQGLLWYNREDATSFVPVLATDWSISDDGLTYTFNIREGVTFHEGQTLEASDAAYSLQRGLLQSDPNSAQWLFTEPFLGIGVSDTATLVDPAASGDPEVLAAADPDALLAVCEQITSQITADDAAGTVTLTLAIPWGPLLATLAGSWGAVLDKDWAIENGAWDGDCATWQNYYTRYG